MAKRMLMAAVVLTLSLWVGLGSLTYAEQKVAPDPQFEKVAKELYPKAKQEGELIVYTVWDVDDIRLFLDAFSKQFPGIKTSYWQAANNVIVARVISELQAGQASVDALMTDSSMPVLRAAGTVMPYETVQKDALVLHDPTMPVVSLQVNTIVYNTKKMQAADLPRDWEDIVNPKYKGIVALHDPMRAGPATLCLAALWGHWKKDDARLTRFVRGLKDLNVPVHNAVSTQMRLVVSGEYSITFPSMLHDALREIQKTSPIDIDRLPPPIVFPRSVGIYAKSPHPNAAKLLAEWMISPAGAAIFDSMWRTPNRKGFHGKSAIEAAWPTGSKPIEVPKEYLENPREWMDTHVKPAWEGK